MSSSIQRFNLVQLFVQSSQSMRLRKLIVDLEVGACMLSLVLFKLQLHLWHTRIASFYVYDDRHPGLTVEEYLVKILHLHMSVQKKV